MRYKNWIKTGDWGKRHQNVYGLKGKKTVIWLDNWGHGNWAVILGREFRGKKNMPIFKEDEVIFNGSKKDALRVQRKWMKEHLDGVEI